MKLLIISHTPHYISNGQIMGWGPTIREIDHLAALFGEVTHIAPLWTGPVPSSSLPYHASNVNLHFVPPSGGDHVAAKLGIFAKMPEYINAFRQEARKAEMIHIRCPANISLLSTIGLIFRKSPKYRWIKYAGNWHPTGKEDFSYKLQRWLLNNNLHRGVVTVNGHWEGQQDHIYSFYNPCLTSEEIVEAKQKSVGKYLAPPYQLLFVGRLESAKGVGRILHLAKDLSQAEIPFELTLVGDGPERDKFENQVRDMNLGEQVHFSGWLPRTRLGEYYAKSHFMLLPSASEGWPKVLSEAMAYGAMVLASDVSSIPQILKKTGAGLSICAEDSKTYSQTMIDMINNPARWKEYSSSGMKSAVLFSYDYYLGSIKTMASQAWGLQL